MQSKMKTTTHIRKRPLTRRKDQTEHASVPTQFGIFPAYLETTSDYTELVTVSSLTSGNASTTYFNLNSMYAATSNGGNSVKPYGTDQTSAYYSRYRVESVDVDLQIDKESSGPLAYACGPLSPSIPTAVTTLQTFLNFCMINRVRKGFVSAYVPTIHKFKIKLWQLISCPKKEYMTTDRFQSSFAASPSETARFYVVFLNESGSTISFDFLFTIKFRVRWFDPAPQSGSTFRYLALMREDPIILSYLQARELLLSQQKTSKYQDFMKDEADLVSKYFGHI